MTASGASANSVHQRFASLDIIRGAVMVLMALDHVRVFSAVPAWEETPTPSVFFTRWITNFCAPAFVFLAGTGAFLHAERLGDKRAMSKYLLVRGALLVFLEMTISRFSWTFNFDFYNYTEANVIWAIGWSMIVLAVLIHLPLRVIAAFGIVLIAGHNVLDPFNETLTKVVTGSALEGFWRVLYFSGEFRFFGSGPRLVVLYTLVPWVGVMAAGYAFGIVMQLEAARRRTICLRLGLGAVAFFVVLRAFNLYGNPWGWSSTDPGWALISFVGTNKYPASFQFLLMTLGPTIALVPVLDNARGRVVNWLSTFGRVPLFYYLLHLPVIHLAAVLVSMVRTPDATSWLLLNHPLRIPPAPEGYRWSLPLLYAVTTAVVFVPYFPCRWYAALKARRRDSWITTYI